MTFWIFFVCLCSDFKIWYNFKDYEFSLGWCIIEVEDQPVYLIRPQRTRSLSLTGSVCYLNCKHCGGFYLKAMDPFDPLKGIDLHSGVKSLLISGGVDESYTVPFMPHISVLSEIRQKGVRINLHVGFPSDGHVAIIDKIADVVSLDIPGTDRVLEEVYGIGTKAVSVIHLYHRLIASQIIVHPHITVGLAGGKVDHEYHAIRALEPISPKILVMNVFIPTPGSTYAQCAAPDLKAVEAVFRAARASLPHTKLVLGCMQPPGRYRLDLQLLALETGFHGWVQPVWPLIDQLVKIKQKMIPFDECCAFVHTLMDKDGEGGKSWNS